MDVLVVGGHGKVARRLLRLLAQDGHRARGTVRKPEQQDDLRELGAEPVLFDIEKGTISELAQHVSGADAVVFAAGAGPGSGAERKRTVDLNGALMLIRACQEAGVKRYVMVSSIGAHDPSSGPEQMRPYLEAKHEADEALRDSGLDWTITRPGSLTDDPGNGRIEVFKDPGHRGQIPRDDVAATLYSVLRHDNTIWVIFELFSGETPIDDAVASL
jgi:uncharacterized protein YbjT (DUF2867 family)